MKHRLWSFSFLLVVFLSYAQQKPSPRDTHQQTPTNEHGTEQSPVVVKILPTQKTQQETTDEKQKEKDQSDANWWMVRLTAVVAVIGCIQTIVFGLQARRLKQTIDKMDEISTEQTADIQASLTQSTLAAEAMQGIASSMAINVQSVKESVANNREIADRQKLVTELGSRAYLIAIFAAMTPQIGELRFQPHIQIVNKGNTPAYNVRFSIFADVVPFPLRDDFRFILPTEPLGTSSAIGPGLHKIINAVVPRTCPGVEAEQITLGVGERVIAWGIVKYRDAFDIERFIKFGFTFYRIGDNQWMAMDTERHNDAN